MINKRKIKDIYERYAPNNITLQEFTEMVERDPGLLDSIVGEFSTFNPELAKIYKGRRKPGGLSDDDFRIKLKESMSKNTMDTVAQKYADIYAQIICSDDDILLAAWTFKSLNRKQRQELALKIVNEINNYFGINDKLKIRYLDKKNQQPIIDLLADFYMKIRSIISGYGYESTECNAYYDSESTITMFRNNDFMGFLGFMCTISHEYGHFIDKKYPDLGSLGAQISAYSEPIYSLIDHESNPTEVSSYRIGCIVMDKLEKILIEQAIKKPELYTKALKILIDYAETKLAGLRIKYKKYFESLGRAEKAYQDLKLKYIREEYPNYEYLSAKQLADITHKINQRPDVKRLYDEYHRQRTECAPSEYKLLDAALSHYKSLLKAQKSDKNYFDILLNAFGSLSF